MNFKHALGLTARDKISGYTGIVTGRTEWFYGCLRYNLQAPELKDGKPVDEITIDEEQLELLAEQPREGSEGTPFEIESRALVRDTVTGYKGRVVARVQWLYAGNRYYVQAEKLHDGKPVPTIACHARQLDVIEAGEPIGAARGGPAPSLPREASPR